MGNETRHMHLYVFCRVHPGDQELAPLGPTRGVYTTMEEVEAALDELEAASENFDVDVPLVEFRGPGIMMTQTASGSDTRSREFGGDGRCHRTFVQVWCIGDPDECAAMIADQAHQKMMAALPQMLESDNEDVRAQATLGLMAMLKDMLGELEGLEPDEDIMRLPDLPKQRDFGVSYANEPFDDFLDFGGFDEPTDRKRLN